MGSMRPCPMGSSGNGAAMRTAMKKSPPRAPRADGSHAPATVMARSWHAASRHRFPHCFAAQWGGAMPSRRGCERIKHPRFFFLLDQAQKKQKRTVSLPPLSPISLGSTSLRLLTALKTKCRSDERRLVALPEGMHLFRVSRCAGLFTLKTFRTIFVVQLDCAYL